ncbi:uncharacterized protein LOC111245476 isoform X1 [Varroa destructor]|uniref:Uncharacterized protein n=1 Tax=Varroa destructor TaxID=109461 RepID=A0A7M7J9U8_VARDE|nr:uncharacterized protein LOC111245182 isoform X1 [Varroa destructor]XP_022649602.1 uncharacterized protein LOC111245476 isoform X1 [Varroa destructor]
MASENLMPYGKLRIADRCHRLRHRCCWRRSKKGQVYSYGRLKASTMWFSCVTVCFCISVALAQGKAQFLNSSNFNIETQNDAEQFMEDVLAHLPNNTVHLAGFYFKIKKTLLWNFLMTHRDINAWFNKGQVSGIDTIKTKSCRPPTSHKKKITVKCLLDLNSTFVVYEALVTGFNLVGTMWAAKVEVRFRGTEYSIEITNFEDGPLSVTKLILERFRTELIYPDFGFNVKRNARFKEKVNNETKRQVVNVIASTTLPEINAILRKLSERK